MKDKKIDIDEIFSSKLNGFEMDIPDGVWENLSKKLAQEKSVVPQKKSSKRKILLWCSSIAASLLVLFFFMNQEQKKSTVSEHFQAHVESPKVTHPIVNNQNNENDSLKTNSTVDKNQKNIHYTKSQESVKPDVSNEIINQPEHQQQQLVEEPKKSDNKEKKDLEKKMNDFENSANNQAEKLFAQVDNNKPEKSYKRRLAVAIGGGMGLANQTVSANQLLTLNSSESNPMLRSGGLLTTPTMTSSSKSSYQLEHSWPVSFIVGISKPLNHYVNLEVGISYSYLYSKQKGESNATMKQTQQFSYIGLPIALNIKVANWGKFRMGILAGGSIQKDIAGRLREQVNGSSSEKSTENIHQKYFQPSINSNLHLSYSIAKNLNLYGKFGGAYYFNMNDNYSTIYSDKGFLPDVGFGLSYSFGY